MPEWVFQRKYKRSPSFAWDFLWLVFLLILLSFFVYAGATQGFSQEIDLNFFSIRMAPVYSLFGTVCLAYEFFTSIRNESNKNRLNQELIKNKEYLDAAKTSIIDEFTRLKRINSLSEEINELNKNLNHEMQYVRRKFYFGWFGVFLTMLSTLLQVWNIPNA